MNSNTLKSQRNAFITSVANYSTIYQNMINKINSINATLSSTNDAIVYNCICNKNKELIKKINSLQKNLEIYKQSTLNKVDERIRRLEYEEKLAREANDE